MKNYYSDICWVFKCTLCTPDSAAPCNHRCNKCGRVHYKIQVPCDIRVRPKANTRSTLTPQVIKNLLVQCIVAAIKISFPDQTRDKGQLKWVMDYYWQLFKVQISAQLS